MKVFLTLIILLISEAHAANTLLTCLGGEEKRLHAVKDTGPLYDLNQKMISEMTQIPEVTLTPEAYKSVCQSKRFSESWKLLELSLRQGKKMFVIPKAVTGLQRSITEGMIDDYVEVSKDILLGFISQIQTISPTPDCLLLEIPELDKFFTRIKYLQEDVDIQKLMEPMEERIFDRLKDYRPAFQRCRERAKKKAKSASTAPPKNP